MKLVPGHLYLGKNGVTYLYLGYGDWKYQIIDKNGHRSSFNRDYDCKDNKFYSYIQKSRMEVAQRNGLLTEDLRHSQDTPGWRLIQKRKNPIKMVEDLGEYKPLDLSTEFTLRIRSNYHVPHDMPDVEYILTHTDK